MGTGGKKGGIVASTVHRSVRKTPTTSNPFLLLFLPSRDKIETAIAVGKLLSRYPSYTVRIPISITSIIALSSLPPLVFIYPANNILEKKSKGYNKGKAIDLRPRIILNNLLTVRNKFSPSIFLQDFIIRKSNTRLSNRFNRMTILLEIHLNPSFFELKVSNLNLRYDFSHVS